ncbi:hypothetical protein SK128_014636 [Halocaridina rubra]|uniref:Uncharacterized protein n=1 Tax=Halocaridina rubra TaxID=373956 RepID=A0AAN8WTZ6_HALRR
MDAVWVLVLLCTFLWLDHQSLASISTTKGVYIKTNLMYENTIPQGAIGAYAIANFKIRLGKPWNAYNTWKCGRRCLATAGCKSIVVRPSTQTCFLSKLDRCTVPTIIDKHAGFHYYELIPGNSGRTSKTCYDICVAEKDCEQCGRRNCLGEYCDICPHHCWENPLPPNGTQVLWNPTLLSYVAECNNRYQLVVPSSALPNDSPEGPLELRLVVDYSGTILESFFDFYQVTGLKLSVGNFTNGTAGNWWDAPFLDREKVAFNESNCISFYYSPPDDNSTCESKAVISYDEQTNLNLTLVRGLAWYTGDNVTDEIPVTNIQFWMRKIGC